MRTRVTDRTNHGLEYMYMSERSEVTDQTNQRLEHIAMRTCVADRTNEDIDVLKYNEVDSSVYGHLSLTQRVLVCVTAHVCIHLFTH